MTESMVKMKDDKVRQTADLLPAGFDPHQAMSVLTDYIRNLEEAYEDLKKTYGGEKRQLESEYRALLKLKDDQRQEIDRLTSDLLDLTNSFEEQESQLATANQKLFSYEKQFKKHQRDHSELMNKLGQKENDASFYRQELARSVQENEHLNASLQAANQRLDDSERKLAVEREAALMHEKEGRRLNLILSESQGKIALTERKLEESVVKYSNEIKRLMDRSNADAVHEVNLLKKRIISSVAPEMRELLSLMGHKSSLELCHAFKTVFARYLDKLEQVGLDPAAIAARRPAPKKRIIRE